MSSMSANTATTNIHTPISKKIWSNKYCYNAGCIKESGIEETWRRVACAIAKSEPEPSKSSFWTDRFLGLLQDFRFLPGGRILAGAGTDKQVTLFNCFVMGRIDDSIGGIFDALRQGAITMQQGGGVGYDFSSLRPKGFPTQRVGATASGPVSFMRIWDTMCETLLSTGARRGAMMATLRCDHPDIEDFITAKQEAHALRHFNLSVLISDAFMQAVRDNQSWPLVFPLEQGQYNKSVRKVDAVKLWQKIIRATYDYAEPGVLFSDHINNNNNLYYREHISCTNPCGEIPLPPYGACDLGSINLTSFVSKPFTSSTSLDFDGLENTVKVAVRFLDNVIDLSHYPLPEQKEQAQGSRRIGLGITGLADTFAMFGVRYGDPSSMKLATRIISTICHTAYRTSIDLARERGVFPYYEKDAFLESRFVQSLPTEIQEDITTYGIRNSHLIAIAPTGTISLLANNISSGIEPVFDFIQRRRILQEDNSYLEHTLEDYAYRLWKQQYGDMKLPAYFVNSYQVTPEEHVDMQAALQPYVDNAISKTINIPHDYPYEKYRLLYEQAYNLGLKGFTAFRSNPVSKSILQSGTDLPVNKHCCNIEREAD